MKVNFKYYLHDDSIGNERAEVILDQINLDMSKEELNQLIGRPFYEVQLDCVLDTETGKVEILRAKN